MPRDGNGLSEGSKVTVGMARMAIVIGLSFGGVIASATVAITRLMSRIETLEKGLGEKFDLHDFQGWVREYQRDPSKIPEAPR